MIFSHKNHFMEILNLCTNNGSMQDGYLFCFKNQPKSVLKDVAVYALTFHCNCCRFETVFMTIFKIGG